jgi:hypothetical protein
MSVPKLQRSLFLIQSSPRQSLFASSYLLLVEASGNYERLIWHADANTTPDADAADGSCVFYLGADPLR